MTTEKKLEISEISKNQKETVTKNGPNIIKNVFLLASAALWATIFNIFILEKIFYKRDFSFSEIFLWGILGGFFYSFVRKG